MKFNISKKWCEYMAVQETGEEISAGSMMWDEERLKGRGRMRRVTTACRTFYFLGGSFNLTIFLLDAYRHYQFGAILAYICTALMIFSWFKVEQSSKSYFDLCAKYDAEFSELLKRWEPSSGGH